MNNLWWKKLQITNKNLSMMNRNEIHQFLNKRMKDFAQKKTWTQKPTWPRTTTKSVILKKKRSGPQSSVRRATSKIVEYLEWEINFVEFIKISNKFDPEHYFEIIFRTGLYRINKTLEDHNKLVGLFVFLSQNWYPFPCLNLINLEYEDFFKKLYDINPLLKREYTHIIYHRNG